MAFTLHPTNYGRHLRAEPMVQLDTLALVFTVLAAVLAPSYAFVFAPAATTAGARRIGAQVCGVMSHDKSSSSVHTNRNTSPDTEEPPCEM